MKYLRKFASEAEYAAFKDSDSYVTPNVVLVNGKVDYNPPPPPPLYIEALENLTVTFSNTYEYSKDNVTWTSATSSTSISANAGEKVFFRASGLTTSSGSGIGTFTISSGKCNVGGNVMSMAMATKGNYNELTKISKANQFRSLFANNANIIDASKLLLPATTLASSCYYRMFFRCTGLTTAPELPAATLASSCYYRMFYGCSNLNYIKAMFTTSPSTDYMENWVSGVSASGTFVKNSAATWPNSFGTSAIPSGWTVETANA